jgi:cell division GTPase FtsZ
MKRIAIIGLGNCGSQIAALAEKKYPTLVECLYINTSDTDMSQVKNDSQLKFRIGKEGIIEGTGKNRKKMKKILQVDIKEIIGDAKFQDAIKDKKYVFIVASAAGGTGSGSAPVMLELMKSIFHEPNFILVGILPTLQSSLGEHANSLEFLKELYTSTSEDTTYMLYDNETVAHLPPTQILTTVNEAVVDDLRILSGIDNVATPFDSIDEADMETIITVPGRLIVGRITKGLTEKVIEDTDISDLVVKALKSSMQVETNRDNNVYRWGIITYFNERVNKLYCPDMDKLIAFIGTPIERFNHNAVHSGPESTNYLYFIASGLSSITDRIARIDERVAELQAAKEAAKNNRFNIEQESAGFKAIQALDDLRKTDAPRGNKTYSDIFSKFE